MRRTFEDKTRDERVTCHSGTFTETEEQDGWADIVVIAQVGRFICTMPLACLTNSLCRLSIGLIRTMTPL